MVKIKQHLDKSNLGSTPKKAMKNKSFNVVETVKSPKESGRKFIGKVLSTPINTPKSESKKSITKKENFENIEVLQKEVISETKSPGKLKKRKSVVQTPLKTPRSTSKLNGDTPINNLERSNASEKEKNKYKNNYTENSTSVNKEIKLQDKQKKKQLKTKNAEKQLDSLNPSKAVNISELEEKFNVKIKHVEDVIKGVVKFRSENPKTKSNLFQGERFPLFLQISCHRIPSNNTKVFRIPLKNSILTPDDEICLIVPEVKGIKNIEHDKVIEHYEAILRRHKIENIKTIMTRHQFHTEHDTFEQKRRLVDLYDVFLVDGRISGRIVHKAGKFFYEKRKVPTPVKMQATKLKEHFEQTLKKTQLHVHFKGNSFVVQFGHSEMDTEELAENVFSVLSFLENNFPGGFENLQGIHVYTHRAPTAPIYLSLKNASKVHKPKTNLKKPKAHKIYRDELTTHLDTDVTVEPSGKVKVHKVKSENQKNKQSKDEITDADIIQGNDESVDENTVEKRTSKKSRKRKQVEGAFIQDDLETEMEKEKIVKDNEKKIKLRGGEKEKKLNAGENVDKKKKVKKNTT